MKSYSDIEQSKVLAKILPLESADMYYEKGIGDNYRIDFGNYADISISKNLLHIDAIPCWSLAALLCVLPKCIGGSVLRMDMSENDFNLWFDDLSGIVDEILPDITKDNPVDACVEMIEKLHESNLEAFLCS